MGSDNLFPKIGVLAIILICSTKIRCHQEEFSVLETNEKHNLTVVNHKAIAAEFPLHELDVPKDAPSYYWCVEAVLNNVDKEKINPEPTEIILSNGNDVRSMSLPVHWYDLNKDKIVPIVQMLSLFCHDGHQTLNDSLRVLINTRSVKPIDLSLNVTTCTARSQDWVEDSSDGSFSSSGLINT